MGEWKKTQCAICALSCGLEMEVEDGKIVDVRPDKDSPRSHGYCCRKGRAAAMHVNTPDRLDYPLKKVGDHFERISWDQAIKEIAERANKIIDEHGPQCMAFIGGGIAAAQEEGIFGRGLTASIGSQYSYNAFGIEFMGHWWSHGKLFGDQMHFLEPDDHNSEVLIFWGGNSYASGQILNAREVIREASANVNRTVVVVDPRLSETARMSDIHIMLRPGTDSLMLRAMIALILKNGWEDKGYLAKYAKDLDKVRPWFEGFDIEGAFKVCNVGYKQMEDLCRLLTTKKWGAHPDLGIFMGRHNTLNCYLLLMLECICGMAFMPGGCITSEASMKRGDTIHEEDPKVWRSAVTNRFPVMGAYPSATLSQEILTENENRLRVAFCGRSNTVCSFPDAAKMEEALKKLELFVVVDFAMTETARLADYVLPEPSVYESYDINMFQLNYPEVVSMLRRPVLPQQVGERRQSAWIWIEIIKAMGKMPEIPQSLYKAAEKAARTNDRIPFLLKLLPFVLKNKVPMDLVPALAGEILGRYMESPVAATLWIATVTAPFTGHGMTKKAGIKPSGKHRILEKLPVLSEFCLVDAAFQKVLDTPGGAVIGISDPETMIDRHLVHKDHKIHLYCDEINQYIQRITPEQEEAALTENGAFPFAMSAGRHFDDGANWIMRNPKMNSHRNYYTAMMNPEDGQKQGFREGDMIRVTTRAGSVELPVHLSWQTSPGYVIVPHHYGFISGGKKYGETVNLLTHCQELDEITGNPFFRHVNCRVEKAQVG